MLLRQCLHSIGKPAHVTDCMDVCVFLKTPEQSLDPVHTSTSFRICMRGSDSGHNKSRNRVMKVEINEK